MSQRVIQFYGAEWRSDCIRSKQFLDDHGVQYEYHNLERDPSALARVREINNGRRIIPTIVFPDGDILVEPGNAQLASKLRLSKRASP